MMTTWAATRCSSPYRALPFAERVQKRVELRERDRRCLSTVDFRIPLSTQRCDGESHRDAVIQARVDRSPMKRLATGNVQAVLVLCELRTHRLQILSH